MHVRCCFIPRLRSSKRGLPGIKQQRLTFVRRFIVVIRLGFEPKTHSLEGCCSIQLSYRTDPYLLLIDSGTGIKSGCKDSDYFWICNKMFWFGLFLFDTLGGLSGYEGDRKGCLGRLGRGEAKMIYGSFV